MCACLPAGRLSYKKCDLKTIEDGCLLFYGVAILPYLLFASLIKLDNIKPYMLIAVILLNVELISFLISGQSIIATILTSMKSSENYILIAYPLVLLMSYFISKRILKINF